MKKRLLSVILVLGLSIALVACGGASYSEKSSNSYDMEAAVAEESYNSGEMSDYIEDSEATGTSESVNENAQSTNRKLIKNVNLSVETKEYDTLMKNLETEIKDLGGYIENMDAYNGSSYSGRDGRYATIIARIPAVSLDGFVSKIGEAANITNRSETVEDVTLQYVDMDSHKKMLAEEQERLMALLEQATSIEDIITIESRLSEVRYQIESMESQLRTFDNQVDYSTVSISISEVKELTPVVEESAGTRIRNGFVNSLNNVLKGIKEFFIGLIIALPYLIVWGIVIAVLVFIIMKIIKISDKRTKRLAEERRIQRAQISGSTGTAENEGINSTFVQRPDSTNEKKENK